MSTHRVEVVPVRLEPHPNADTLSIVRVYGYSVCVRTEDFRDGDLGAYIPPDSMVDTMRPEFAFLRREGRTEERVKVKKLRGIVSQGLLVPAPAGTQAGDDVANILGVSHYEPPLPSASTGGEAEAPPPGNRPTYELESLYRYGHVFEPGEPLVLTEKIHGASARYCWHDGRMYAGSKNEWKRPNPDNLWWRALAQQPEIERFCQAYPHLTVYAEVYGNVQDLKYGLGKGQYRLAVFDLWDAEKGRWVPYEDALSLSGCILPWVPEVQRATWTDIEGVLVLVEGPSCISEANHLREGIVVAPLAERTHLEIGRVKLKAVSNDYLERR